MYIFDENMPEKSFPSKNDLCTFKSGMTNSAPEWKRNNKTIKNKIKKEAIFVVDLDSFYLNVLLLL